MQVTRGAYCRSKSLLRVIYVHKVHTYIYTHTVHTYVHACIHIYMHPVCVHTVCMYAQRNFSNTVPIKNTDPEIAYGTRVLVRVRNVLVQVRNVLAY